MKNYLLIGLLLLCIGSFTAFSNNIFAQEISDSDKDGVRDEVDQCPYLKEDNEGVSYNFV